MMASFAPNLRLMRPPSPTRARRAAVTPRAGPAHWAGLAAAAVSGAALAAAFPSLGWNWLAWIALVPLFMAVARARHAGWALGYGYAAGALFFGFSCPWIETTVRHFGNLSPPLAGIVFLCFVILMGAYLALFALLGYLLGRQLNHRLLPLPFLWVAVEWLRTYTPFSGFPWNLLGSSQAAHAGFMLAAPIAGVYGASLVIALANTLIADQLLRLDPQRARAQSAPAPGPRQSKPAWAAIAGGVGLALILAWATFPYHPPALPVRTLRAQLVQPNTPLDVDWTTARMTDFLGEQWRLSTPPGSRPVDLILWPEQPAPLDYARQTGFQEMTAEMVARTGAAFLFEEVTYPLTPQGGPDYNLPRNSALLIRPDGTTGPRYDKIRLVPFGEYVPLAAILRWAGVSKLVQGVSDFEPGEDTVLFHARGHAFATLICYESIFPALARRSVAMGAEWLVNQSDDGWYGASSAGPQGLQMAQMRAIENRRWLLRATNDGITAVIDPYGRITATLPRFTAGALEAGFNPRTQLTFYTRHGDWLAALCVAVLALLELYAVIRPRLRAQAAAPGNARGTRRLSYTTTLWPLRFPKRRAGCAATPKRCAVGFAAGGYGRASSEPSTSLKRRICPARQRWCRFPRG